MSKDDGGGGEWPVGGRPHWGRSQHSPDGVLTARYSPPSADTHTSHYTQDTLSPTPACVALIYR